MKPPTLAEKIAQDAIRKYEKEYRAALREMPVPVAHTPAQARAHKNADRDFVPAFNVKHAAHLCSLWPAPPTVSHPTKADADESCSFCEMLGRPGPPVYAINFHEKPIPRRWISCSRHMDEFGRRLAMLLRADLEAKP